MKRQHTLGMRIAHCEAMRQAAIAAHNPKARDYWFDEREKAAAELTLLLHPILDGRPAPRQRPLFVDDLTDLVRKVEKKHKR